MRLAPSMERLEKIRYQAASAIIGCWQGSNRNKLYEQLEWESLSDRMWARILSHFYKIYRYNSPGYLYERVPQLRIPIYGSRSPNLLHEIKCRTANIWIASPQIRCGAVVKGVEHISIHFVSQHLSGAGSSPAGSVYRDLNLQKPNYHHLTTSVAVVLVVRWYFNG